MINPELTDWIIARKNQGHSSDQIYDVLVHSGYPANVAQAGIQKVFQIHQPSASQNRRRMIFFFIIALLIILGIGGDAYVFLNTGLSDEDTSPENVAVSPTVTIPQTTPSSGIIQSPLDINKINTLFESLKTSSVLEITVSDKTLIGKCEGISTYHGIIQDEDAYSLSQSSFTAETVTFCPADLQGIFAETYWVGGTVLYKQYPDKPFAVKKPEDRIAVGIHPKEYLRSLLPNTATTQLLPGDTGSTGEIRLKGKNGKGMETTYGLMVSDDKIKKMTFQTTEINDPDFGMYTSGGTADFKIPDSKITSPAL